MSKPAGCVSGMGPLQFPKDRGPAPETAQELPWIERLALSKENDYNKVDLGQPIADLAGNTEKIYNI